MTSKPKLDLETGQALIAIPSRRKAYVQGIAVAMSNPKAILLIGALFPQFIDATAPIAPQFIVMAVTMMVMSFSALTVFATLSSRLVARGKKAMSGKLNKISGALFIAFGAALASGMR